MKKWNNWIFFMIGWLGGAIMAEVNGLPNKIIVVVVVCLVYIAAGVVSGLTQRAPDRG
jgi:hypothetical protein